MLQSRTIGIAIGKPWKDVYERIWRPESFPKWASGLSRSSLVKVGDGWTAEGPAGTVRIRFTDHNAFGVMDHYVDAGTGSQIYIPLRVIANAEGAEVLLTLFQQPGMSEQQFLTDAKWVERDLVALKALLEGVGSLHP
ncbi:MAG TPA: hypothetical protein VGM84_10040 [Steroidobacteraceae bacterium]|jgi:hypothetical protein